jgi:hypothetical protein
MTTTLEELHRDPATLDRAISRREELDILSGGEVAATLLPKIHLSIEETPQAMRERFAAGDWSLSTALL